MIHSSQRAQDTWSVESLQQFWMCLKCFVLRDGTPNLRKTKSFDWLWRAGSVTLGKYDTFFKTWASFAARLISDLFLNYDPRHAVTQKSIYQSYSRTVITVCMSCVLSSRPWVFEQGWVKFKYFAIIIL